MRTTIPRIILLGASNLTRGISIVVETASLRLGRPVEVLAALGHGRSYGSYSRVLGRTLPGIVQCGLWEALQRRPTDAPTYALITDVGNDIVYGEDVPTIIGWVEQCLDQLQAMGARIIFTQLPMATVRYIPPWKFRLMRRLLFPSSRITFEQAMAGARQMSEALDELAAQRGLTPVSMNSAWYGLDPIHITTANMAEAWAHILSGWTEEPMTTRAAGSLRRWITLRRARPEHRWIFGREMRTPQPAARLPDGTMVSLY